MPDSEKPKEAFEVSPLPRNVSALKEAVKEKMTHTFARYDSYELVVYHAGPTEPRQRLGEESHLRPNAALVEGDYYLIEAPARPPTQGC